MTSVYLVGFNYVQVIFKKDQLVETVIERLTIDFREHQGNLYRVVKDVLTFKILNLTKTNLLLVEEIVLVSKVIDRQKSLVKTIERTDKQDSRQRVYEVRVD